MFFFLELNSTKPSLIYDNFNTPESTAAQKQIRKRCFDVHRVLMWYAKKYSTSFPGPWLNACHKHTSDMSINHRLRSPRPIGITSAFRITYSLTYLQHAGNKVSLLWSWNHKNIILFSVLYRIFWCHFFASWEWTWGGRRILYLRAQASQVHV